MTLKQRNDEIAKILKILTEQNTVSQTIAKKALIAGSIYTKNGKIRKEFGGEPAKKVVEA